MTNEKFCDVHGSETGRRQPIESMQTLVVEKWMKVKGKNRLFYNRLDICLTDVADKIVKPAKALGVNVENNWKTDVWLIGENGKKYKSAMSMDEYIVYFENKTKDQELAELRARTR